METVLRLTVSSVTKAQLKRWIQTYGLTALFTAWQARNQYQEGQASKQKEKTYKAMEKAIPKVLDQIQTKEIHVIPEAFNSSARFLGQLERAALIALPLVLLDIDRAIRVVGRRLEAIRDELAIANVARVQGWAGDGFGAHIHRFVQNEMRRVLDQTVQNQSQGGRAEDRQQHYFYLWNPDTDWYPTFEERTRAAPLGPEFGGYHHDLDAICLRMRADRETLLQTTSHGQTAMFHLLIPSYSPIVIDHPVVFHPGLLPLTITGQRHRDVDFVWFNLDDKPPALKLYFIGLLTTNTNLAIINCARGVVWMAASCAVAAVLPPSAPVAVGIALQCLPPTASLLGGALAGEMWNSLTEEEIHILGHAVLLPET